MNQQNTVEIPVLRINVLHVTLCKICYIMATDLQFITKCTKETATFDVCMTVHHWYNNINNQLDAKITVY